jgi:hypothetical protein
MRPLGHLGGRRQGAQRRRENWGRVRRGPNRWCNTVGAGDEAARGTGVGVMAERDTGGDLGGRRAGGGDVAVGREEATPGR